MYSILIVDDEELICKGLKSMIERNCPEIIDKISYTMQPLSVIGLIEEARPDIIITDIRMPDINGLELIKHVSESYPQIKFIALSGYDDFNYVKEAFKLGVVDYLLKPASIEELLAVLGKVIAAIEAERQRNLEQISDGLRLKSAVLENNLNKLFAGILVEEESLQKFYREAREYFGFNYFVAGIVSKGASIAMNENGEWIAGCLEKYDAIFQRESNLKSFKIFSLQNEFVIVLNLDAKDQYKVVLDKMEKLTSQLERSMGADVFAAASNVESGMESIFKCYRQAKEALEYKLVLGSRKIILYKSIASYSKQISFDRQLAKIKENIASLNNVELNNLVDQLFDQSNLKNYKMESIRRMYTSIVRTLEETINNAGIHIMQELIRELDQFNSLGDARIHIKTVIFEMITGIRENHKNKSVVDLAKDYVHENLHKDIDLAMVANMVSVSYSHFSKMFKDETGMNFTDYLMKARMEKALEMLNVPLNRVQDISSKVGYANPKHFTRAFKNFFGFSPSEYRNN